MYKKLITACMAIAAFAAFVVPSTASAAPNEPTLVEGTTPLAVGAKIVGTNIGITEFTNTSGTTLVECDDVELTGEVVKNKEGTVEGTIETAHFAGTGPTHKHNDLDECTGDLGNAYITVTGKLCVRSTPGMATHEFQTSSATGTCTGLGNVQFVIGSTTIGACEYESTSSVKGHLVKTGSDEVSVTHTQTGSGAKKVSGGFFCPSSGMLKMSYTLETHDGTAVNVVDLNP